MNDPSKPSSSESPLPSATGPLSAGAQGADSAAELLEKAQIEQPIVSDEPDLADKVKTLLIGKPRDFSDQAVFKHISLIAFFAWVGLGADGLSSSVYGPAEAFHTLVHDGHDHSYLAVFLALATMLTVWIISACYSHIIEEFPAGGGGYLAATKMLGRVPGLVSGCALLIDYVLTVTVSIAAAGDALFSLAPNWAPYKLPVEITAILVLVVMNLRGVKESISILMPVFLIFLISHTLLIGGALGLNIGETGHVVEQVKEGINYSLDPVNKIGILGLLGMFLYAYSFGAGTYTGIESVSNSMPLMREPRVATAKRTMVYMAISLALTAGGLILGYMLLDLGKILSEKPLEYQGLTLNAIFTQEVLAGAGLKGTAVGEIFLFTVIVSAATLCFVAAQAGFMGGPRSLANMAHDSWVPHWFAHLSERLATHNGIMLFGIAALGALVYTHGDIRLLVIMYSINVFITFSLSMIGMCRLWWQQRGKRAEWKRRLALFALGAALCMFILLMNIYEKFLEGGWVTIVITGALVVVCLLINRYYKHVYRRLSRLNESLGMITTTQPPIQTAPDPNAPTAAILVGGYSGLGIHTLLNAIRFAPGHFKNVVFLSAAVIDSGNFKGADAVEDLKHHTEENLGKYVDLARRLGLPATSYMAIGTDAVEELEHLCVTIAKDYPKAIFFAGQLVFRKDIWYQRLLHNQTAYSLQRRLQWDAIPMVILPTRVR